jgi:hypothetical protein
MNEQPHEFGLKVVDILLSYIHHRGGQVSYAWKKVWTLNERNYKDYVPDLEDEPNERYRKLQIQNLDLPSVYPYTDITAAMRVLAERDLPNVIENQVDFNLSDIELKST